MLRYLAALVIATMSALALDSVHATESEDGQQILARSGRGGGQSDGGGGGG